jgi:foldase protein PrsA
MEQQEENLREDELLLKKLNAVVFVIILGLAVLGSALPMFAQNDEIVARVNGVEITMSQFIEELEKQYGPAVLEQLIMDELVAQKQAALGITISDEYFTEKYAEFINQIGGPEYLMYLLFQYGITEAQLQEELRYSLLVNEMILSEIEADQAEVAAWFEENRARYDKQEAVTASHILVQTQEEAEAILAELEGGADFAALAQERSLDPGSASQGGNLGQITRGVTVEPFENMAFSLGVGEMGIVESQYGWHVILVTGRSAAQAAVLDEIYSEVESDYKASLAPTFTEYLQQLKSAAEIEIVRERYK